MRENLQTYAMRRPGQEHGSYGARVAYIRTEQTEIKPNDPNLLAVTKVIADSDKTILSTGKIVDATTAIIKNQEGLEGKLGFNPALKHEAILTRAEAAQEKLEATQLKQEAIQCLGTIGNEASSQLPKLFAIVQDKNEEPMVVVMALWAMSMMPSEIGKVLPVIDKLRSHENEVVKKAATNAYKALTIKASPKNKNEPPKK